MVIDLMTEFELCNGPYGTVMKRSDEIQGWLFAVERGLLTPAEAEERATMRAARVLRRAMRFADSAQLP